LDTSNAGLERVFAQGSANACVRIIGRLLPSVPHEGPRACGTLPDTEVVVYGGGRLSLDARQQRMSHVAHQAAGMD